MLEFVFKKEELAELIKTSDKPECSNVIVRLAFSGGTNRVFQARVIAFCEDESGNAVDRGQISGCPRPPGCE